MAQDKSNLTVELFTARASLATLGTHLTALNILAPINVKRSPFDKLQDALIAILAGARGMIELNTRLRADPGLQRAFGQADCAEQSVVQFTLNRCTPQNVGQMMQALDEIFRKHSATARHDFKHRPLIIDLDLTGLPCGKKCEAALKGYQAELGIRYGRQLCRALAAEYEEVIVDRLYPGNLMLSLVLQWMIEDIETTLQLSASARRRTVIRMDAGGATQLGWLLARGYQIHAKDNSIRAKSLASAVTDWTCDPAHPGRELGWLPHETDDLPRPVKRLLIRWQRDRTDKLNYACLVSTLPPQEVFELLKLKFKPQVLNEAALALAYSKLYDLRGGAVEIEIKESKQGLGLTKRAKKYFAAQQMVILLGQLAHNILVWARSWLARRNSAAPQALRRAADGA